MNGTMGHSELPRPTPVAVARYFLDTYGPDLLFFTVVPFDQRGRAVGESTFGSDNIEHIAPWLSLQMAKLLSGKVETLAMIVRVFDFDHLVRIEGSKGPVDVPEKDLYMFRFDLSASVGFNEAVTLEMRTYDLMTGTFLDPEPDVHCRSGERIVAELLAGTLGDGTGNRDRASP